MPRSATPSTPPSQLQLTCASAITLDAAMPPVDNGGAESLPRFRMVAYTGDAMRVAGWRHPVVVDLDGLNVPTQRRPIRFAHSAAHGIGHTERIAVEAGQLVAEGVVSRDTPEAREVVTSGKRGFPWQASIGAAVDQAELVKAGKFVTVNGRSFEGPVYVARKTTLGEISFVDLGADGGTSAAIAAQPAPALESRDMPDEPTQHDDAQHAPGHPASSAATTPGSAPSPAAEPLEAPAEGVVAHMRTEAAAEAQRIADVRRVCAGRHAAIEAKAIGEGWDATRTELEVLRASRPSITGTPAIQTGSGVPVGAAVLEAACLLTARLDKVESLYDERTLDAAAKRFRGGIGLQELLLEAAWANGYTGRNFRNSREVLRAAFSGPLPGVEASGGLSTIDVGGILSNVSNKFLLEGFFSVERTWRNVCAVRNVSDFKTVTSYRLVGKDQYEQVAPGGELKHGSLGEETYTNKADTYGLLLSIDRRDIINDDLGAITTVPRKLGRGSGLKINDVFWTKFLGNVGGNFFHADNKNFLAGADTALSIDGLTKAEVAFMDQVDSDGKPIGIMPSVVLVPTALSAIGTQLHKSLELRDTSSSVKYPVANPHQGKFRVEVSRYLANSTYAGSSAKAWYLLADPTDLPVIEVAFLNGQESPTIETADADFNVLGVQMRGYHDFGVELQDPRGGVKSKGEV